MILKLLSISLLISSLCILCSLTLESLAEKDEELREYEDDDMR